MAGASGYGAGVWWGAKKRRCAPGRDGGPFLIGGAAALATCWGEGGRGDFFVLPPAPESEAA